LNYRYLAYIALLAGWICFCYWLYAEGISPRLHGNREKSWPEYSEDLPYPLAYTWMSDVPLAGKDFGLLKSRLQRLDSLDEMVIMRGYYFRDEADNISQLQTLAKNRINSALKYIEIDPKRLVTAVSVQEITADVRANPFEAVRFELIHFAELIHSSPDTFELCFPLQDSLTLAPLCKDRLTDWIREADGTKNNIMHIVGTADGTGIAESSDIAMERAMLIKQILLIDGWKEEQMELSTGQRNHPLTIRNRCVLVYFE
jgi:hypothetical protein